MHAFVTGRFCWGWPGLIRSMPDAESEPPHTGELAQILNKAYAQKQKGTPFVAADVGG